MKWWSFAAAAASSLALLGAPATAVRPAERLPTIREDCREDSPPGYYHDAPPHYDEHRPDQYDKNAPAYGNDHVVGWDRGWTKKNPPPPWWNQRLRDNAVYEGVRFLPPFIQAPPPPFYPPLSYLPKTPMCAAETLSARRLRLSSLNKSRANPSPARNNRSATTTASGTGACAKSDSETRRATTTTGASCRAAPRRG